MTPQPPPDEMNPKMPDNLPPLPPVPDGYDRLEYRGEGWNPEEPRTYFVAEAGGTQWNGYGDPIVPLGNANLHYIEAVKDSPAVQTKQMGEVWAATDGTRSCLGVSEEVVTEGIKVMQETAVPAQGGEAPKGLIHTVLATSLLEAVIADRQAGEEPFQTDVPMPFVKSGKTADCLRDMFGKVWLGTIKPASVKTQPPVADSLRNSFHSIEPYKARLIHPDYEQDDPPIVTVYPAQETDYEGHLAIVWDDGTEDLSDPKFLERIDPPGDSLRETPKDTHTAFWQWAKSTHPAWDGSEDATSRMVKNAFLAGAEFKARTLERELAEWKYRAEQAEASIKEIDDWNDAQPEHQGMPDDFYVQATAMLKNRHGKFEIADIIADGLRKLTAAKQDSERLEWLLMSDFVDSALITNREEIDAARREEGA